MANEIFLSAPPGLSPIVQLYNGTTPVGPPFSLIAIALTGDYVGDMPSVTYGRYNVLCYYLDINSVPVKLASGQILWDGAYEIPIGLAMLAGMDPNNPMHAKSDKRSSGAIDLKVDGYGSPETIVTRQ